LEPFANCLIQHTHSSKQRFYFEQVEKKVKLSV
jgi:hypothetical protein